jgi:glyoxylase-like metal-dependent hydrolase (beta-lactamase superfamily II)
MTVMGALWVKGSDAVRTYTDRDRLDVPGRPEVVFTPGHTLGHCSLLLADRGATIVGDAFVNARSLHRPQRALHRRRDRDRRQPPGALLA